VLSENRLGLRRFNLGDIRAITARNPNVIISEDVVIDPELLLDLLARERVTRIVLVPTLLRVLLEYAPDLDVRVPMLMSRRSRC
jgi:hypothetical protein